MNFPNFTIESNRPISKGFLGIGLNNFQEACTYIKNLCYQRTSVKSNLLLVLEEKRGTSSSKHALLNKLAEEKDVHSIELSIGIYKMTAQNPPGIGALIPENIPFIPEAHTYLVFNNCRFDFTRANGKTLKNEDVLKEILITADEIGFIKEKLHKEFITQWCKNVNQDFNKIWEIREACIERLSR